MSIASHVPVDRPHVAFVDGQRAVGDGDARHGGGRRLVQAERDLSEQRVRPGAAGGGGRDVEGHSAPRSSGCRPAASTRTRRRTRRATPARTCRLMASLNDGLTAFYNDLRNSGLLNDTLLLSFSEFGRRVSENGSRGTDHGSASVMLAMGGGVRGGLYGTAPSLEPGSVEPDAREQRATTSASKPTSARSTRGSSTTGWAATQCRCSAGISGRAVSTSSEPDRSNGPNDPNDLRSSACGDQNAAADGRALPQYRLLLEPLLVGRHSAPSLPLAAGESSCTSNSTLERS